MHILRSSFVLLPLLPCKKLPEWSVRAAESEDYVRIRRQTKLGGARVWLNVRRIWWSIERCVVRLSELVDLVCAKRERVRERPIIRKCSI